VGQLLRSPTLNTQRTVATPSAAKWCTNVSVVSNEFPALASVDVLWRENGQSQAWSVQVWHQVYFCDVSMLLWNVWNDRVHWLLAIIKHTLQRIFQPFIEMNYVIKEVLLVSLKLIYVMCYHIWHFGYFIRDMWHVF